MQAGRAGDLPWLNLRQDVTVCILMQNCLCQCKLARAIQSYLIQPSDILTQSFESFLYQRDGVIIKGLNPEVAMLMVQARHPIQQCSNFINSAQALNVSFI